MVEPVEASSSSTVTALLLQEAQSEIANLRTDLYNTRRLAEERRQALTSATTSYEAFKVQVASLTSDLGEAREAATRLGEVEEQLASVHEDVERLQREVDKGVGMRKVLQDELAEERSLREELERAKASLESERARLATARDAAQAQARVAQKAAKDAEEEQLAAEDEAAALRAEVATLRDHVRWDYHAHACMHGTHACMGTIFRTMHPKDAF